MGEDGRIWKGGWWRMVEDGGRLGVERDRAE